MGRGRSSQGGLLGSAGRLVDALGRGSAGFSLLELVVVIAIISALVAVAIDRLLPYIDEAERVAVLRVEGQLRSTLMMEAAQRIVGGQSTSLSELEGANSVKFLLEPPKNYAGERLQREIEQSPTRRWYYEQDRHRLVYRLGEPFGLPVHDESLLPTATATACSRRSVKSCMACACNEWPVARWLSGVNGEAH